MKRMLLLFFLLAALVGCGSTETVEAPGSEQEETGADTWGITVEEAAGSDQTVTAAPSSAMETESVVETSSTPAPTPTPEPAAASLEELCPAGPKVLLDGTERTSLLLSDVTLVNAADISELLSWFQWQEGRENASFTRKNGEQIQISCLMVEGTDPSVEGYDGTGGICFTGQETEYWLPVRWLAEELGLKLLWDAEQNTVYLATQVDMDNIPQGVDVPILMYHAVSDNLWGINSLFVSPEDMRQQLEYLTENGYDPIFFSDLPHLEDYDKPILLTFDDGYDDNYEYLFPLLQEFQVKATIFVITGMLGDEHYMTEEQVRELSDSGLVDIQSHTVDHYELATLSYDEQAYQMAQSQLEIARITGKIPYVLSYPTGIRDGNTLELAPEYYSFGVDMNGGVWRIEEDYFKVDRIYVSRFDTLDEYIAMIP